MSTERIPSAAGAAVDRPFSRSLPGALAETDRVAATGAGQFAYSTAELRPAAKRQSALPLRDNSPPAAPFGYFPPTPRGVLPGTKAASSRQASRGVSRTPASGLLSGPRGSGRHLETFKPISVPTMPSTSVTVAAAALLAVVLLVVPALLPPLQAPPMELLLLPVFVMGLLIFVARSPDSTPAVNPKYQFT